MLSTSADNILLDLHNSPHPTQPSYENGRFSSLIAARERSPTFPSGDERGETSIFAGYTQAHSIIVNEFRFQSKLNGNIFCYIILLTCSSLCFFIIFAYNLLMYCTRSSCAGAARKVSPDWPQNNDSVILSIVLVLFGARVRHKRDFPQQKKCHPPISQAPFPLPQSLYVRVGVR